MGFLVIVTKGKKGPFSKLHTYEVKINIESALEISFRLNIRSPDVFSIDYTHLDISSLKVPKVTLDINLQNNLHLKQTWFI